MPYNIWILKIPILGRYRVFGSKQARRRVDLVSLHRVEDAVLGSTRLAVDDQRFNTQVERLLRLDYPKLARLTEADFLAEVEPARRFFEPDALLVIPEDVVPIDAQLEAIGGRRPLDAPHWRHRDTPPLPTMPFVSFDVDAGSSLQNISPRDCLALFQENGRLGLAAVEGIALITHRPHTITGAHAIDLTGSFCNWFDEWHVAHLRRDNNGLLFTFRYLWPKSPTSGSASCKARLAP